MLAAFISAFLVAAVATLWTIRAARQHPHFSGDPLAGPQKVHARVVPRVGGVGLFAGFAAAIGLISTQAPEQALWGLLFLLCSLPAFGTGLIEDLTKAVTPRLRLLATAASGALGIWLLGGVVVRTDIPGVDWIAQFSVGAVFLTLLVVAGVANAINIIDGMNGLASMCTAIMLAGLAYVAYGTGDLFVARGALALIGAVLGFFMWNYPKGLIFLGDGGAYFLGFALAELSLLLVYRNVGVSPLFPLLLCAYPIFETLFSMYRRKLVRGHAVGLPDGIHLHSLIYRRLMRWALGERDANALTKRNSMTSPYLWTLCSLSVIPSVLWWDNSAVLSWWLLVFVISYLFLYQRIVRFRTPRVLIVRRKEDAAQVQSSQQR